MEDDWSNVRDNISMLMCNVDIAKFQDDGVMIAKICSPKGQHCLERNL